MATHKLKVISEYIGRGMHFAAGTTLEADDMLFLFLMADAPGCFAVIEEKAIDAPPVDKMVRKPARKK